MSVKISDPTTIVSKDKNPTSISDSRSTGVKCWDCSECSSENSSNNSLNLNSNGNLNNNNKTNEYGVLPVLEISNKCPVKFKYTYQDILKAYLDCRKHKRNSKHTIRFDIDYEHNLYELLNEINDRTYKIGRSRCFVVGEKKPREIWAANFRDRIIHHLVYNTIHDWFEKRFIYDTCSCIKGKGTLFACKRVDKHARKLSNNWEHKIYYLKMDLTNYFISIDKNILWNIIKDKVDENSLTGWLLKEIIYNDMLDNPIIINNELSSKLNPNKSLFNKPKNKGLPVGNLTSQFFSNLYLDNLDQYCKHVLKLKHYVRYVDDIVILHKDRQYLKEIEKLIKEFTFRTRNVKFHEKNELKDIRSSIVFTGYIIKPWRFLIKHELIRNAFKILYKYRKYPLNIDYKNKFTSYFGFLKHSKSYKIKSKLLSKLTKYHNNSFNLSLY